MSKALSFFVMQSVIGTVMIILNKHNPSVVAFTGIMMVCGFFIFQATLNPLTNIWTSLMNDKKGKIKKIKNVLEEMLENEY